MKDLFSKTLQTTAKFSSFIIITAALLIYLVFATFDIEQGIAVIFTQPENLIWLGLNAAITITLHQIVISTAIENATSFGLETEEYKTADELNGKILQIVGSRFSEFTEFIKNLNLYERVTVETAFLQMLGKSNKEELDTKQLKAFNKLKPAIHDVSNFLRPCFSDVKKNGVVSYDASFTLNKRRVFTRLSKIVFSLLFAFITVGPVVFGVGDIGTALLNALIMAFAVLITFVTVFTPTYYKLRYTIPKKVYNKHILVDTFIQKQATLQEFAKSITPEENIKEKEQEEYENINTDTTEAIVEDSCIEDPFDSSISPS